MCRFAEHQILPLAFIFSHYDRTESVEMASGSYALAEQASSATLESLAQRESLKRKAGSPIERE